MSTSASPDVVVIGGGTAGCVVAGRLAERADRRVLPDASHCAHLETPHSFFPLVTDFLAHVDERNRTHG